MPFSFEDIQTAFKSRYQTEPILIRAPGRINLIGEHTDYNDGFVMPAAIDKEIFFAMALSGDSRSEITSLDMDMTLSFDAANPVQMTGDSDWANYMLGTLRRIIDLGNQVQPLHCVLGGNIPVGAGMSSSAAIECGFIFGLVALNGLEISKPAMALIAQWSENNFVGANTGIMDQYASLMGKKGHAMVLDCRSLTCSYYPLDLAQHQIVLLNSNVRHTLAGSEYNTRRKECEVGVRAMGSQFPEVKSLRDAHMGHLEAIKDSVPPAVFNRCRYVIEENARLLTAVRDLERNDLDAFGTRMFETHEGLSSLYEVSCEELDFLVARARESKGVIGARMMGGGFGGCTINLVRKNVAGAFVQSTTRAYQEAFAKELPAFVVHTGDGVSYLHHVR